ncbi:MAG: hypothetical protein HN368_19520, partial [Spirochaetales bacterium]|nr:hypothetical protein [Spirochaetales bacterium]
MIIYFNTGWDGGPWSDQSASLGIFRTGPLGLLAVLESCCGMSGPRLSHAARVAGMMATLSGRDIEEEWFGPSFSADPWATAAELLSYRDELLTARIACDPAHGSANDHTLSRARLQPLVALLDDADVPGDGLPDRISDVLQELRSEEFGNLKPLAGFRIVADEPEALLPPVWRSVLDAVPTAGGEVERCTDAVPSSGSPQPALTVVQAVDEWQAAEHLAFVLSRIEETDASAAGRFALVVSDDAGALDWTLERRGLPVTGKGRSSAARGGLQILPAFLATMWSPADPHAIVSFLSLSSDLVPSVVSRELIEALREQPGTGGETWV